MDWAGVALRGAVDGQCAMEIGVTWLSKAECLLVYKESARRWGRVSIAHHCFLLILPQGGD